ncbi:cell surface glycoprotein 1 [Anopheles gambiae]|uniref:cell surface glycoprotein 1 n=1 Tax=Anopheles gambiae TaxID=7165 RepID=UPI002AC9870D|nr:cell surface glycoprotein 1 [Anopheles gambiae]
MVRLLPLAVLLVLATLTNARTLPNRSKQVKVYSYVLPAGAEEIRDDINHSFACANRTDGFYVDIDNDCQIFHRCQDHARFSFICAERTVFSQMYQTCVHDGQLGYPCEESAQYYPEGEGYEPSAPGAEAAEEAPQVEEMQPEQQAVPAEELEAPQAPAKAVETVAPSEQDTAASSEQSSQDSVLQPSEQAEQSAVEVNDESEQQHQEHQEEEEIHHQVNADLFDPIEEESEVPSENSAQEVMDEAEPSSSSAVPSEATSSDPANTQKEESNEVEVMDDPTTQQEEQQQSEQEQTVSSEPAPSVDYSDATPQDEVVEAEQPVNTETEAESTPTDPEPSATEELENETQHQADSLINAVQAVEELEPIVHELAAETEELKPLVAELVQDPAVPAPSQEDNELLAPESDTSATTDMEAPQAASDASSSDSEPTSDAATMESDAVNELSPEMVLSSAVPADDSSNTIDTVSVEADETAQPAATPETVDDVQQTEGEAATPDAPERPMESPAIVEEMAPVRPNDSAELPELIVSTEFHLDAITQGPPIRRRKTFLFRADAIRNSRH